MYTHKKKSYRSVRRKCV